VSRSGFDYAAPAAVSSCPIPSENESVTNLTGTVRFSSRKGCVEDLGGDSVREIKSCRSHANVDKFRVNNTTAKNY
jgi:hypothetical protein